MELDVPAADGSAGGAIGGAASSGVGGGSGYDAESLAALKAKQTAIPESMKPAANNDMDVVGGPETNECVAQDDEGALSELEKLAVLQARRHRMVGKATAYARDDDDGVSPSSTLRAGEKGGRGGGAFAGGVAATAKTDVPAAEPGRCRTIAQRAQTV